jgi:hypothetical protein
MCILPGIQTQDPQNTVPWRLYQLSNPAHYKISPLNSEKYWTMTYCLTILKFVLEFLMGTENNVKLDLEL